MKGIEKADSVTLDGHKLLYLPLAHGAVLFKEAQSLNLVRHNANYIIRKGSIDLGQTSLEGSRRFNALKLWFSIKMLGLKGYNVLFSKAMRLTSTMKDLIDQHIDFERTSEPEICILTYRYLPEKLRQHLYEIKSQGDEAALTQLQDALNAINIEIQKRQREYGVSFVSRTTLESTVHTGEIIVFRSVLTNLLTRESYLTEVLEEQQRIGEDIIREKFPEFEAFLQ